MEIRLELVLLVDIQLMLKMYNNTCDDNDYGIYIESDQNHQIKNNICIK